MEREKVLTLLRQHQAELEAAHIQTASLFGSVARGEPNPGDVDLAVRFRPDAPKGWDIFPVLDTLEARLRHLLDSEVDILEEPARKPGMQAAIDKDRVIVF